MEGARVPKWKLFQKVLEGFKMEGFQNDRSQNGSVCWRLTGDFRSLPSDR
jgi:hypothetical protein